MKLNTSILLVLFFFVASISSGFEVNAGKKIPQIIAEKRNSPFRHIKPLEFSGFLNEHDNAQSFVSGAVFLNLRKDAIQELISEKPGNVLIEIPVSDNHSVKLELTRSYPVSEDFILTEKNGVSEYTVSYDEGLHYWGVVKGDDKSIASVSVFRNFIMGVISGADGNFVLGSVKENNQYTDKYIFYNDADLRVANEFKCDVDKYENRLLKSVSEAGHSNPESVDANMTRLPVRVYFEADYKLYQDGNNNSQNVADFITGFFNSVKTIYQNESIPFEISQIGIWTAPDPYVNLNDSYLILTAFGGNSRDIFNGNIAHLLSTRTGGLGGIAWIRVLCSEYNSFDSSGRFAFSNIDPNYNNYPTYSWTVNVVAHEMGHSMGSRHTHACVWPVGPGGAIRAIDSCYYAEGGCFVNLRGRIGTIMSYCHLWSQQGFGVNLALGFGPLPGDTIRLRYNQAACLDRYLNSSEAPVVYDLQQNFPNPFNPETKIRFDIPEGSYVSLVIYDANGRTVGEMIKNRFYERGYYEVRFNAAFYGLSSGIYFYKLTANRFSQTKRMVLLK